MRRTLICGLALLLAACTGAARADEAERIAELMRLGPGMRVADVGAGDGDFAEALARRVGETGHVWVNEIDDGELIKIRERIGASELANMSAVEGTETDTRLPEACCDAILLRRVYHHLSHPEEMRASLHRSLRPGGRLVVVEMTNRKNHEVDADRLVAEMTADGFRLVSRHPGWNGNEDHYAAVFSR